MSAPVCSRKERLTCSLAMRCRLGCPRVVCQVHGTLPGRGASVHRWTYPCLPSHKMKALACHLLLLGLAAAHTSGASHPDGHTATEPGLATNSWSHTRKLSQSSVDPAQSIVYSGNLTGRTVGLRPCSRPALRPLATVKTLLPTYVSPQVPSSLAAGRTSACSWCSTGAPMTQTNSMATLRSPATRMPQRHPTAPSASCSPSFSRRAMGCTWCSSWSAQSGA